MDNYFMMAGVLVSLVGVIHSVLGEVLIFRHLRAPGRIVPSDGRGALAERQVRIIWASWHVVSVFGWGMGLMLIALDGRFGLTFSANLVADTIAWSALLGAFLVLIGTRGKHPGWIGLTGVAALVWLG